MTAGLDCLAELSKQASRPYRQGDRFRPVARPFVDGFEVRVLRVGKDVVAASKGVLTNVIQSHTSELMVRNLLCKSVPDGTAIWVTLSPESAILTPRTLAQVQKVVYAVKSHG